VRITGVTLLEEIIDGASGDVPVASLLRKLKVVAARAGTVQLEAWVEHELGGYPNNVPLPTYRGPFATPVAANLAGPFGSSFSGAQIGPSAFPAKHRREWTFKMEFRQPIVELEDLVRADRVMLQVPWSADLVAYVNDLTEKRETHLNPDYVMHSAWKMISPQQVLAAVDSVRTRVLDLGLSIERLAPDAGQAGATAPDGSAIDRLVIANIYGGNVAIGSTNVLQEIMLPQPGDKDALFQALAAAGVDQDQLDELERALTEGEVDEEVGLGSRAMAWAGKVATGGAAAVGKSAATGAGALVLRP
jgi:AbiTii